MSGKSERLSFYVTPPYDCNYLPGQEATSLFADARFPKSKTLYSSLVALGFRRSGEHLYQPSCAACSQCVPVRIPVNTFSLKRTQKRTWNKNQDLQIHARPPVFKREHYRLYRQYLKARHAGAGMDDANPDSYMKFLTASWPDTVFLEMRLEQRIVAIAVVDRMNDALSAVYTFFDDTLKQRSLGTFAILYEIQWARRFGYKWVYLGYWIAACDKMKYKTDFRPIEFFIDGAWRANADAPLPANHYKSVIST